jgi:LPXTG-motif cell wall-anchored protein
MKKILGGIAVITIIITIMSIGSAVHADVDHCPDHNGHPGKVESGAAGNSVIPPAGAQICVKGSTGNTGLFTADGSTSLIEYMAKLAPRNNGGNIPDVSYYIVYSGGTTTTTTTTISDDTTTTVLDETTTTVVENNTTTTHQETIIPNDDIVPMTTTTLGIDSDLELPSTGNENWIAAIAAMFFISGGSALIYASRRS